jgi:hypothetical protein
MPRLSAARFSTVEQRLARTALAFVKASLLRWKMNMDRSRYSKLPRRATHMAWQDAAMPKRPKGERHE